MTVTGLLWIGFQFYPDIVLLVLGAVFYFAGLTAFVAFVVAMLDQSLRRGEQLIAKGEFRTG